MARRTNVSFRAVWWRTLNRYLKNLDTKKAKQTNLFELERASVSIKMELFSILASAEGTLNGRHFFHFCPFNGVVQS
jgi:hypothetical protein